MNDDIHDKPSVTLHQVVVDELGNEIRRLSAINDDMLAALEAEEEADRLYDEWLDLIDDTLTQADKGAAGIVYFMADEHAKNLRIAAIAKAKSTA